MSPHRLGSDAVIVQGRTAAGEIIDILLNSDGTIPFSASISGADGAITDGATPTIKASVVASTDDPTKNGVVALNPDGSDIGGSPGSAGTEYTEGDVDTSFAGPVVQGEGPSNVATPLQLDSSGQLKVVPPTGYATSAKQDTGNTSVASIDTKTPALGQALAAGSVPVVLPAAQITTLTPPAAITGYLTESDFDTKVGSLTESAPGTDIASSGLNGRLQRIAQRLSSLITALGSPFQAGGSIGNTSFASTVADGANVTLGAKADAKNTATDTTAITAMSVWKQISASVQLMVFGAGTAAAAQRTTLASDDPAVASLSVMDDWDESDRAKVNPIAGQAGVAAGAGAVNALTQRMTLASDDPAVATLGATTGAAVITDANGTIQQYLRGLIKLAITAGSFLVTATLAAGTALIGRVASSDETSTIYNGTTALTPKFAAITASSSGATQVVAAVSLKKIRVTQIVLVANAAVNVKFQSHVIPTDLTGLLYLAANTGFAPGYDPTGHFETLAGEALDINLSTNVAVGGWLKYIEV